MPRVLDRTDREFLLELIYRTIVLNESVSDVATHLNISRSKAHALLKAAKDDGLVETTTVLQPDLNDELKFQLQAACRQYDVKTVVVLPSFDEEPNSPAYQAYLRSSLGRLAAKYVSSLDWANATGDHVGYPPHLALGGGRMMVSFAQHFAPKTTRLVLRPLTVGGRWRTTHTWDATAVLQAIQSRLQTKSGSGISILCPERPPGELKGFDARPEVRVVFGDDAPRPVATVCGIGHRHYVPAVDQNAGPHPSTSSYVQLVALESFYRSVIDKLKGVPRLGESELRHFYQPLPDGIYAAAAQMLEQLNVIGDICRHGITPTGHIVETDYQRSSLTVKPEKLREWRKRGTDTVLVAGGRLVAPVVQAALFGRFFSTLIVDTALAMELIPASARPFEQGSSASPDIPPAPSPARASRKRSGKRHSGRA